MDQLQSVLDSNPDLKSQYEFLLNRQKQAVKALEDFTQRILKQHSSVKPTRLNSQKIADLQTAKVFMDEQLKADKQLCARMTKLVNQQKDLEKSWETTHRAMIDDGKDDIAETFLINCHEQLESFQKRCSRAFILMDLPLFSIRPELIYPDLEQDKRDLLNYIKSKVEEN